ncbi:LysM and putative peptidoglycan-binding domain-containing protein 1 [Nymphaea thermarum]|nr:LysM and putative peptidoglycan-binding domain-containing protein 1 [Nymphaea thermarum]
MRLQGSGGVRMISLAMDNGHRNGNCHVISGDLSHRRLNPMPSNSSSVVSSSSSSSNVNYIEHHVSKMDTLAGVAIRYGVEVSDIKRLNGLVTDLQMFAHKSLQIPLPGRHPPSPIIADGSVMQENSVSLLNGFSAGSSDESLDVPVAEAGNNDTERSNEKPVRRRQRTDVDPAYAGSELGEDTTSGGLLGRSVKGLALRLKSASRVNLAGADVDSANNHAHPFGDSLFANGFAGVRRSSSTSNLQEPLDGAASNRSASKWTLRPDLQVLTAVAIPIFDGLPKPISGKRNKAALD